MLVQFKLVSDLPEASNWMPSQGSEFAAGYDLRAAISEPIVLYPNMVELISTGYAMNSVNRDIAAFILPRSGLGHKQGIVLGNLIGLIDPDYQGELQVSLWNRNFDGRPFIVNPGDRIAQMVFFPAFHPMTEIVKAFTDTTARGANGYGSSGIS